jgi:glycosidase
MKWHDGDAELTDFHRSLSTLRREYPVLKRGAVEPLSIEVAARGTTEVIDSEAATDAAVSESTDRDEMAAASNPRTDSETVDADQVVAFARDDGTDRLLVVINFGDRPQAVSLPEAVGSTDRRTGSPLRKRYPQDEPTADAEGERDTYIRVDDVVICQSDS